MLLRFYSICGLSLSIKVLKVNWSDDSLHNQHNKGMIKKMQTFPPTVVIRHRLENLKKCTLRGLESRSDFVFLTYPYKELPDLSGYIILSLDAPPLSVDDSHLGLLVLDATWRYANKMFKPLAGKSQYHYRSLPPSYRTAYPRRQQDCPDPERGLASIEAIYLSYLLLGRDTTGLLDLYHWKENFLKLNHM
jgi:pre-rRNA-processing protein TSR3